MIRVSGTHTLHTTDSFRVTDVEQIAAWLAEYPLVTLVSADEHGRPRASVSPLLLRRRENTLRLFAHLDRRNPQLEHIAAARPLLVIAQGPQAYVSPGWFSRRPAAPTYLHVTVHVQATPSFDCDCSPSSSLHARDSRPARLT